MATVSFDSFFQQAKSAGFGDTKDLLDAGKYHMRVARAMAQLSTSPYKVSDEAVSVSLLLTVTEGPEQGSSVWCNLEFDPDAESKAKANIGFRTLEALGAQFSDTGDLKETIGNAVDSIKGTVALWEVVVKAVGEKKTKRNYFKVLDLESAPEDPEESSSVSNPFGNFSL